MLVEEFTRIALNLSHHQLKILNSVPSDSALCKKASKQALVPKAVTFPFHIEKKIAQCGRSKEHEIWIPTTENVLEFFHFTTPDNNKVNCKIMLRWIKELEFRKLLQHVMA